MFEGLKNYTKVFQDAGFLNAFKNTAAFAVVTIILINVLAFFIAYALTQKMRGANLFRTVFFMPNLIGGVVLGYIWSLIFDGILKNYSTYLTANGTYGFWGLVILVAWQQIGYMMIIYIAGLQAVSEDMLEAAKIDGASGWQTLTKVIIPNVMPSITTCTFLTLTNSFKLFDQNLALTGGLPSVIQNGAKVNVTELLALNIYSTYNINKKYHGVAQTKAVIFFLLVAVLALIQQAATRKKGGRTVMNKQRKVKKYTPGSKVLTVFFIALCLVWVMPVIEVLINSFKSNNYQPRAVRAPDRRIVCRPRELSQGRQLR